MVFELPICVDATRTNRMEIIEWIQSHFPSARLNIPDGPLAAQLIFHYVPLKHLSKAKMRAIAAGDMVPRPRHPECHELAGLVLEAIMGRDAHRVCDLSVQKIYGMTNKITVEITEARGDG
jgi:hypothetical protein